MNKYYEYKKCTTCRKGKKYLEDKGIDLEVIDMVEEPPSEYELKDIVSKADNHEIDDFFNTRGKVFKDLGLKEKLDTMSFDEKIELLSSDGMLIKRPMLVTESAVVLGFKEEQYEAVLND
ncbi:Spx/MgsR family RNA polymerase-binding regulatory protein [Nosocomiicoccus massiliensis]|uniref:Spx/MgsR family RNA polymerase-binding regulatory protein n=1 Tax=Nosocomiicoccus massiliensis TaxID=1232430 RepID=UPI0004224BFC|nr:Spx/MgsR family RNA polymerase-binding regulatory protein [Nosocomiicoccus massiliensis]